MRSRSLGAEARTVVAAGAASSGDPAPSRGTPRFHPLPLMGTVGPVRYPAPRPLIGTAADMSSASRVRLAQVATVTGAAPLFASPRQTWRRHRRVSQDGAQSLSRLAPLIGTGGGGLQGLRTAVCPLPRVGSALVSPWGRVASLRVGSESAPVALTGHRLSGVAAVSSGSGGRRVVGIAVVPRRGRCGGWERTGRHHRGNVLRGQAHRGCRVTFSVT